MTPERKRFFLYVIMFAMAGSAMMRTLLDPCPPQLPPSSIPIGVSLFGITLLIGTFWIREEWQLRTRLSLMLQVGITVWLLLSLQKESPTMLFFAVGIQAIIKLPAKERWGWLIGLTLLQTSLLVSIYGPLRGLSVSPIYASAFLFMGLLTYLLEEQEKAADDSQHLLLELREAYQKLQVSAAHAEEFATTQERNRIARELHDSVTQMLFSMNLLAQTTKVMAEKEAPALSGHLGQLQTLTQDALSEMRYLIFQLRPGREEQGLLPALRQHVEHLEARHPVQITLDAKVEPPLSNEQAHKLFRITQEALNNVLKHAQTDKATVRIAVQDEQVTLSIADEGVGFLQSETNTASHSQTMGLSSMEERATLLGASIDVSSQPGEGTQISVTLPLLQTP